MSAVSSSSGGTPAALTPRAVVADVVAAADAAAVTDPSSNAVTGAVLEPRPRVPWRDAAAFLRFRLDWRARSRDRSASSRRANPSGRAAALSSAVTILPATPHRRSDSAARLGESHAVAEPSFSVTELCTSAVRASAALAVTGATPRRPNSGRRRFLAFFAAEPISASAASTSPSSILPTPTAAATPLTAVPVEPQLSTLLMTSRLLAPTPPPHTTRLPSRAAAASAAGIWSAMDPTSDAEPPCRAERTSARSCATADDAVMPAAAVSDAASLIRARVAVVCRCRSNGEERAVATSATDDQAPRETVWERGSAWSSDCPTAEPADTDPSSGAKPQEVPPRTLRRATSLATEPGARSPTKPPPRPRPAATADAAASTAADAAADGDDDGDDDAA